MVIRKGNPAQSIVEIVAGTVSDIAQDDFQKDFNDLNNVEQIVVLEKAEIKVRELFSKQIDDTKGGANG